MSNVVYPNPHKFDEEVGLLRTGTIVGYSPTTGKITVELNNKPTGGSAARPIIVYAPYSMFFNNGLFMGTAPSVGTPIVVGQGSGNQYYFVSFIAENRDQVPDLNNNELLIQSNSKTKITLDKSNNIYLGSVTNKIHIDTDFNLSTSNFHNEQHFTQAYRQLNGLVRRERKNITAFEFINKLEADSYDAKYKVIGLDPTITPAIAGSSKNPALVEHREMIYEFQLLSNVTDDLNESQIYGTSKTSKQLPTLPNRRNSKADTLSLTLAAPNYLMESVKGTVVDIFGNILDINRVPLPIGKDQTTLSDDKSTDKVKSFLAIKELERKSIAYHFEINARKDFSKKTGATDLFDLNSNADYARNRSRFFLDIDKEGQLKLNVPASSERGNLPLLVRYENFSTFSPEDNGNPNKLIYREDSLDIFQDSFAAPKLDLTSSPFSYAKDKGSIKLKSGDTEATPIDRITNSHIKHGTAYHDILATCYAHQRSDFIQYQHFLIDTVDAAGNTVEGTTIDVSETSLPLLKNIVTDTIKLSGLDANAGGRSASLNFDGMVEMNIGANTIDRQSLWLDTAGGIVANIGRDKKLMSAAVKMDGDLLIQVGGIGVVGDSRFVTQQNGQIGAVVDLRVFTDGLTAHMIRIDKNGVSIMTPGSFNVYANNGITFGGKSMTIDVDNFVAQGRLVQKITGGSI